MRQGSCHRIHQFVEPGAVFRRYGVKLVDAEAVELVDEVFLLRSVYLVDDVEDVLARLSQDGRDLLVSRRQALPAVHHKEDDVGLLDGEHRLFPHLDEDGLVGDRFEAAGVDDDEGRPFQEASA